MLTATVVFVTRSADFLGESDVKPFNSTGVTEPIRVFTLNSSGNWAAGGGPSGHQAGYTVAGTGNWSGSGTDGILRFNASTGDTGELLGLRNTLLHSLTAEAGTFRTCDLDRSRSLVGPVTDIKKINVGEGREFPVLWSAFPVMRSAIPCSGK